MTLTKSAFLKGLRANNLDPINAAEYARKLSGMTRIELLNEHLIHFESEDRVHVLLEALHGEKSEVFWRVLLDWWNMCDNIWSLSHEILHVLRRRSAVERSYAYLEDEERAFFETLPQTIPIYRGCSRSRVGGLSWTTDESVAEGFATGHRSIRVPDPVVAAAQIDKGHLFFVLCSREESEIVVDPSALAALTVKAL